MAFSLTALFIFSHIDRVLQVYVQVPVCALYLFLFSPVEVLAIMHSLVRVLVDVDNSDTQTGQTVGRSLVCARNISISLNFIKVCELNEHCRRLPNGNKETWKLIHIERLQIYMF